MIDPTLRIQPCDLFFTRSKTLVSKGIRFMSWGWGQPYPACSHVGGFAESYSLRLVDCIEALNTVERHGFWDTYGGSDNEFVIYRPKNLTQGEKNTIIDTVEQMVGMKYGWGKIALHMLDAALLGSYFFRRFGGIKNRPICSWVWAAAYAAADKNFGIDYGAAQPDDMLDFCIANPDKYEPIVANFERLY